MIWPWIAGGAALLGLILIVGSVLRVAKLMPRLRHAQLKLEARRGSVDRLRSRVEDLQSQLTELQRKLPAKPE